MPKNLLLLRLGLAAAISFGAGAGALAQSADPPGRVGRLSYMEGTVSFHTADQDQWSPATLNYPVVAGESFWTEPQSRAELEVGSAAFRLDETTALDILALDDNTTQLRVDQGVVNIHLRSLPPGGVQLMTASGEIDLVEPGSYHIDAGQPNGDAPADQLQVTVLDGKAEATAPRGRIEILAGESAAIRGNPPSITLAEGNGTPFDDWALQRDRREEAAMAQRYVSPETTGYQDLDDYGQWGSDPTYGQVWYPTAVAVDWAPYRYGHWAWVPPWGWTWIDDAPWGFAPFHYGRWVEIGGRWGWCPGEVVARPVYAPALVAFVGGAGWGVTITAGSALPAVGWVPLAPFEVYHPYYHTSVAYVRNVNITSVNKTVINNITNVTVINNTTVVNKYVNNRATTVVAAAAFTHAAPVQKATLAVPHEQLAQAHVVPTVAHLKPTAAARAGVAIPAAAAVVPHPNAPAHIAQGRVPMPAAAPGNKEPLPPKAPGPAFAGPRRTDQPQHAHGQPQVHQPAGAARVQPQPSQLPPHGGAPGPAIHQPAVSAATPTRPPTPPHPPSSQGAPAGQAAAQAHRQPTPQAQPAHQPAPVAARPPRPPIQPVERPVQQTRLAPTPQGWQRQPMPHAPANHPAPPHAQPGQPPSKDRKPDEHKSGG
jgi:hypothetical protein